MNDYPKYYRNALCSVFIRRDDETSGREKRSDGMNWKIEMGSKAQFDERLKSYTECTAEDYNNVR